MMKQALANKETEIFYHCYKNAVVSEIGRNLRYVFKQ